MHNDSLNSLHLLALLRGAGRVSSSEELVDGVLLRGRGQRLVPRVSAQLGEEAKNT